MELPFNEFKTILILYEESGVFTNLYKSLGFNVITHDLKTTGQDIRLLKKLENVNVYGILAFPPCTHLAVSGARWFKDKGESALIEALSCVDVVFRLVQMYKPKFWMIENPVGRLVNFIGKPSFIFNPCDFGGYLEPASDQYTKKTCLWGEFSKPIKKHVEPIEGSKMWSKYGGASERTKQSRSQTPLGFAKAFISVNQ